MPSRPSRASLVRLLAILFAGAIPAARAARADGPPPVAPPAPPPGTSTPSSPAAPATPKAPAAPAGTRPEVCEDDLKARVRFLADPALEGRMSTEAGATKAEEWIASEFQRLGLAPLGEDGGWFRPFEIPLPRLGAGNALEATVGGEKRSFAVEKDWNPYSVSASREVSGALVFAGYGVANEDRGYDDWAGIEPKGKVVLVLRKEPPWGKSPGQRATFLAKLGAASKRGAAALLLVNDAKSAKAGDAPFPWGAQIGAVTGSGEIPFVSVTRATATALLAPLGKSLDELQASIDAAEGGPKPASAEVAGVAVRLVTAVEKSKGKNARNVVGLLEGSDPALKAEHVIVGAHHDHVGRATIAPTAGGAGDVGKVHPGADDNASGTSGLLEIAEAMATAKERPKRSVVFLTFSGEELGLLGSIAYCEGPCRPLGEATAMVNLDMLGGYREAEGMEVGGVGTGAGLEDLVEKANAPYGLKIKYDPQGDGPSDHTSFFRKKVPVLFFFTGVHERYHTSRDTADAIEYAGAAKATSLALDVVRELANRPERIAYTAPPKREGRRAALGIAPAQGSDAGGVTVESVAEEGAAAKAGILAGDVITALDEIVISGLGDLARALGAKKPGDKVLVKVLRDGEARALPVTLGSR